MFLLVGILLSYGLSIGVWIFFYNSELVGKVFKFIMPFVNSLIWFLLLVSQVMKITSEITFQEKWKLYFHNDWSMLFYWFILPQMIIGTVVPLIFLVKELLSRLSKKNIDIE